MSPANAEGPASPAIRADARYQIRAVRVEPASVAVIYRLDGMTGRVCAFAFSKDSGDRFRGCADASFHDDTADRFTIEAIQGSRGTMQSSAYRLDRLTGEVCRFRLPAASDRLLEFVSCMVEPKGVAPGT